MESKNITEEQGCALLNNIQERMYNQTATKKEMKLYFDYVYYLGLLGAEIEKIAPKIMERANENICDQIIVENTVIN